jgi:group I intron endonuclease
MSKGKIYKILNKINGLVYIGCTISSLEKRFQEHLCRCFKTDYKSKLYNSIKKYGVENFTIDLVDECDLNVIYETEKKYIKEFNSYHNGLNSTYGGEGCLGYTHSPEIRKKISEGTKNGNSHKGKTYEELYGDRAEEEKMKRKKSVKLKWDGMNEDERNNRVKKTKEAVKNNSKYSQEIINEIKNKIKNGEKFSDIKKEYSNISNWFFYQIKNNKK